MSKDNSLYSTLDDSNYDKFWNRSDEGQFWCNKASKEYKHPERDNEDMNRSWDELYERYKIYRAALLTDNEVNHEFDLGPDFKKQTNNDEDKDDWNNNDVQEEIKEEAKECVETVDTPDLPLSAFVCDKYYLVCYKTASHRVIPVRGYLVNYAHGDLDLLSEDGMYHLRHGDIFGMIPIPKFHISGWDGTYE